MRKVFTTAVLILILSLTTFSLALADDMPPPQYDCPKGYTLDMLHHHMGNGEMEHRHVGLSMEMVDINDDGWICMKHVGSGELNHVHIDNYYPFKT